MNYRIVANASPSRFEAHVRVNYQKGILFLIGPSFALTKYKGGPPRPRGACRLNN